MKKMLRWKRITFLMVIVLGPGANRSQAQGAGQPDHPRLGHQVVHPVGRADVPGDAAQRHHPAPFLCDHVGQARLRQVERAVDGNVDHVPPFPEGHLQERLLAALGRIAHQDVDAAQLVHRGLHHAVHGLAVGDVGHVDQRLAAGGLHFLRHLLGGGLVLDRVDDHAGAVGGQRQYRGAADVAGRSGDDGNLAGERAGISLSH